MKERIEKELNILYRELARTLLRKEELEWQIKVREAWWATLDIRPKSGLAFDENEANDE